MNKIVLFFMLMLTACLLSSLTLKEAKELTLKNNSRYLAQKSSYESAKWNNQQALSGLFPSLTASGSYVYQDPSTVVNTGLGSTTLNHDLRSAALTLSQPLFMGGKLWQAYKISSISAEMSRLTLVNQRLIILNEVEIKYYNVLQLKDLLAISEKDLASTRQNLNITAARYENGVLSQADYLKMKAKAASKEVALIQSQTAYELAKQDLFSFLGLTEAVELQPIEPLYEQSELGVFAEYDTQQTLAFAKKAEQISALENLSLKTAEASVILTKKTYSIAKGSFLPTISLSASRSYKENGFDRYEFEGSNTFALTASIPLLPLWNNYSGSRKAYYDVQKSKQDFKTASDGINLAVKSSALNLISSARQVKAAEIAKRFTEQTYQQMQERFRNNMLSTTDMLDAEIMLTSAEINLTNALYSYLKARSTLLQVLGTDDRSVLNSLME